MMRRAWSSVSNGRAVTTSTLSPSESRKTAPIAPPVDCSTSTRMSRNATLRGAPYLLVDGDVAALDRTGEGVDHARIEARAGEALDLLDDVVELHRLLIGPVRGHGVEGVCDGDDACLHRNLVGGQAVGIAAAAPLLMVVFHARDDVDELGHAAHDGRSFGGMSFHHLELVLAQRAGLAQDPVVDTDLADVVQQGADAEVAHLLFAEAEVLSDADRVARHALRMAAGVRVL